MQHLGELAAVATAVCWTGSSLSFGYASRAAGPMAVNQFRLLAAVPALAVLHLLSVGGVWPAALPVERFWLLAASGVVGLVLGDIGYFHALTLIGPRLSSVVQAGWPALAVLLAWAGSGEVPVAAQVGGIALTMAGVVLVLLRPRDGSAWNAGLTPRLRALGIAAALLGALGQAGGFVLSGLGMQADAALPGGVDATSATLVRLCCGAVGICVYAALRGRAGAFASLCGVEQRAALRWTLLGTLCGPVVGIWLSMVAIRHAHDTGTAAALMATTPLFMLPVARFAYGARVGWLGVTGTVVAVAGAAWLLAGTLRA